MRIQGARVDFAGNISVLLLFKSTWSGSFVLKNSLLAQYFQYNLITSTAVTYLGQTFYKHNKQMKRIHVFVLRTLFIKHLDYDNSPKYPQKKHNSITK